MLQTSNIVFWKLNLFLKYSYFLMWWNNNEIQRGNSAKQASRPTAYFSPKTGATRYHAHSWDLSDKGRASQRVDCWTRTWTVDQVDKVLDCNPAHTR